MEKLEMKGLTELEEQEMMSWTGGGFLKSLSAWAIISSMIENWKDIREGFSDGTGDKPPRY
jgi:hypothetical protein